MKRVPGQDNMSHKIEVVFRFFVSDVWPFDCLSLFCAIIIRVHLITHTLFMIYSCSLIGMCMRSRLCVPYINRCFPLLCVRVMPF